MKNTPLREHPILLLGVCVFFAAVGEPLHFAKKNTKAKRFGCLGVIVYICVQFYLAFMPIGHLFFYKLLIIGILHIYNFTKNKKMVFFIIVFFVGLLLLFKFLFYDNLNTNKFVTLNKEKKHIEPAKKDPSIVEKKIKIESSIKKKISTPINKQEVCTKETIFDERANLFIFAEYFYNMNLNISYVSNNSVEHDFKSNTKRFKIPSYDWKEYQSVRQPLDILLGYNWSEAYAIGVILGYDNVAAIDIDGCFDEKEVTFILNFLGLPSTYEWVTKSGSDAGYHILFKTIRPNIEFQRNIKQNKIRKQSNKAYYERYNQIDQSFGKIDVNAYYPRLKENDSDRLNIIDGSFFCKIEFKWLGHIILPPSSHVTGRQYKFMNSLPNSAPSEVNFEKLSQLQFLIGCNPADDSSGIEDRGYGKGISAKIDKEELEKIIQEKYHYSDDGILIEIETNGILPYQQEAVVELYKMPRLLQITWITFRTLFSEKNVYLVSRTTRNVLPLGFDIDKKYLDKHGLSQFFLNKVGDNLVSVLNNLISYLQEYKFIVGHNIKSIIGVIKSEMARCGLTIDLSKHSLYCTMENGKSLFKNHQKISKNKGYLTKNELYFYFFKNNTHLKNQGNSLCDAILVFKCFNELYQRGYFSEFGYHKGVIYKLKNDNSQRLCIDYDNDAQNFNYDDDYYNKDREDFYYDDEVDY